MVNAQELVPRCYHAAVPGWPVRELSDKEPVSAAPARVIEHKAHPDHWSTAGSAAFACEAPPGQHQAAGGGGGGCAAGHGPEGRGATHLPRLGVGSLRRACMCGMRSSRLRALRSAFSGSCGTQHANADQPPRKKADTSSPSVLVLSLSSSCAVPLPRTCAIVSREDEPTMALMCCAVRRRPAQAHARRGVRRPASDPQSVVCRWVWVWCCGGARAAQLWENGKKRGVREEKVRGGKTKKSEVSRRVAHGGAQGGRTPGMTWRARAQVASIGVLAGVCVLVGLVQVRRGAGVLSGLPRAALDTPPPAAEL